MSDFPPVVQLIPHREPMILLDELVDWSEDGRSVCRFTVRDDARFVEGGRLETAFMMEHMAQAVAVCLGYAAYRGGRGVRVGMIVGCRTFECLEPEAKIGEVLTVTAEQRSANLTVSSFECTVRRDDPDAAEGGHAIAHAHLTLYHGDTINEGLSFAG